MKEREKEGLPGRSASPCPSALADLLFAHPLLVLSLCSLLFAVLPLSLLLAFPLALGISPEKGFETDGTPLSGPRLAWTLLQPSLLKGSRMNLAQPPRVKRSWAEDLLASFGSVACYEEPIPNMSFLAQFIVTAPNLDSLFSLSFLRNICQLQFELGPEIAAFQHFSPYRSIWSLPNYVGCLSADSRANCSFLTPDDVSHFRSLFFRCQPHRNAILECRRGCQPISQFESNPEPCPAKNSPTNKDPICTQVPPECDGQMWFDLFYRILPKNMAISPVPVNAFLPFYSFSAYRLQGYDVPLSAFTSVADKLADFAGRNSDNIELKGLSMDIKRDILLGAAVRDSRFSVLAALGVFLLLALYSLSLAFALAVLLQLSAAVISALAVFRLFVHEFPLLNLIVFVLLVSVGSDGAFLLLDTFPNAERLRPGTLDRALRHTAKTMFLTQFSTVVPFLLNLLSSVFAFRSFGLFAGLTLVFNYFLLITFLPAFLVIQLRFISPWLARWWPSRLWYCFPGSGSSLNPAPIDIATGPQSGALFPIRRPSTGLDRSRHFVSTLLDDVLPSVLVQGRFIWLVSLLLLLIVSAFLCLTQLSLPRYNPLQLFRSSNLHEFYDQNAEQLFYFVTDKIAALPFAVRLVWGIRPVQAIGHFDPLSLPAAPEADNHFRLDSPAQVRALANQLEQMRLLTFVSHNEKFWPENFVDWADSVLCQPSSSSLCCRLDSPRLSIAQLDQCIRMSTTVLPTGYNDTLIWDNQTHRLAGYTALLPTRLANSYRFANLSSSFAHFDKSFSSRQMASLPGWFTTEWTVIAQWFDLQQAIVFDCKQSIIVSFLVVFLFSAAVLRLNALFAILAIFCVVLCTVGTLVFLGWEIGVLEGVVLVLVVGLSFDYTLHLGAQIPARGCPSQRIQQAVRGAVRPVGMAACSSILAGSIMLMAETHAFFQVAVFLVVCSFVSLLFALFFFLPLVYLFLPLSPPHPCPTEATHKTSGELMDCEFCSKIRCQLQLKSMDNNDTVIRHKRPHG